MIPPAGTEMVSSFPERLDNGQYIEINDGLELLNDNGFEWIP